LHIGKGLGVGCGFLLASGLEVDATKYVIGAANLIVVAGLVVSGEFDGLAQKRLRLVVFVAREGVQSHVKVGLGPVGLVGGGELQVAVGVVVTLVVGVNVAHEEIAKEVCWVHLQLFGKLFAHLGSGDPFVLRQVKQADEVVGARTFGVESGGAVEFADRVIHHARVLIGAAGHDVDAGAVSGGFVNVVEDGRGLVGF